MTTGDSKALGGGWPPLANQEWYLEGFTDNPPVLRRLPVRPFPFRIGRSADLELRLNFSNVSRIHAEIFLRGDTLMVRDLRSTNGTFVNHQLIREATPLQVGDILGIGDFEFRLLVASEDPNEAMAATQVRQRPPGAGYLTSLGAFEEMMKSEAVLPLFQPIVGIHDSQLFAHELLGRGSMAGLVNTPRELFAIASGMGIEDKLSALFRAKGVEAVADSPRVTNLFMNIHPREMLSPREFVRNLEAVRNKHPRLNLTIEINENAVAGVTEIKSLRDDLHSVGIGLAYDDFGVGQPRLVELAQVPPDYLKFDISLVQDIHEAPAQLQQMVAMLVKFADDVGSKCIAEGIESPFEAETCRQLGFHFGQGYHFGRPVPAAEIDNEEGSEDTLKNSS
ncbi:MAG: EAL domain-containing protein [Candidatus Sumerlaeaceae bacterium]|nr:EAL domain-containing protein [Candidatus Sumerlaeaceae bacterium]